MTWLCWLANYFTNPSSHVSIILYFRTKIYNLHTHTHTYIYIYIYIYGEVVDFSECISRIKLRGKVDKSNSYNKHYIGETQRNLGKIFFEHKKSFKVNALFSNILDLKHTFNLSQSTLIKPIHCKKSCRLVESSKTNHIKQLPGSTRFHPILHTLREMKTISE